MKLTIKRVLSDQLSKPAPVANADLTGKTVVVIGANTGIGFEAVKHFARMKAARIILGCRNLTKGELAIKSVEKDTGYTNAELWLIDLSKFSSVIEFADKFDKDGGRLDILVMNAAVALLQNKYVATPDNWESTIQVNHLGTSLLSLLLLPHLLKTAKDHSSNSRLVIVCSDMHYWATISKKEQESPNIIELIGSKEYCTKSVMKQRYAVSKLLNVLFTRALNNHISFSTPLIVDTVNPGYTVSELRRELTFPLNALDWLAEKALAFSTEVGSRQLVYAAVGGADDEAKLRGAYIATSMVTEPSDFLLTDEGAEVQARIWTETIEILSTHSPKVKEIVQEYLSAA